MNQSPGGPIVSQPKYESQEARRRAAEFLRAVFQGDAADLHAFLERYRCRYVVLDRGVLWSGLRYPGGLPLTARGARPGTVMATVLSSDQSVLDGLEGFRLLYRSALPGDSVRLYERVAQGRNDAR